MEDSGASLDPAGDAAGPSRADDTARDSKAELSPSGESKRPRVDRWAQWRQAARDFPPPAREVAIATVVGALAIAVTNGIAIAATLSLPPAGIALRLQHHAFDALQVMGLAAWLALPIVLVARYGKGPPWLGWLGLACLAGVGMVGALSTDLRRQADAAFNGTGAWALYLLYIVLCAQAVPAAYLLGAYFARVGRWVAVPLFVSTGGVVVSHAILRDDYAGVHTAIGWVAMCLFGAALGPRAVVWLGRGRRQVALVVAMVVLGATAVVWAPPNAVRLQLFREPGAVAAWVLAKTVWRLPSVSASAEPPPIERESEALFRHASRGLPRDPVVVLVTVEALRADVIENRDHDKLLPNLARLRDSGAHFAYASAAGSQTSVSITSLFTSRYFSQLYWDYHGQGRTRFIYAATDPTPRFPKLLTEAGVETHSFVGLIFMSEAYGLTRGFGKEHLLVEGRRHAAARDLMQPLLGHLKSISGGSHFLFTQLMDTHEPYDRGRLKEGSPWDRYLSEAQLVDRWIGSLVRVLKRRFRRRGYLIISGDHGEAFGEHGTHFHTKTLYEEMIRVPLIVWGPGIAKQRIEERASLIDVAPTVLHMFGMPAPEHFMGVSLLPIMRGLATVVQRPVLAEGRLRRALYTRGGLKVIEDTVRKVVEVYDLDTDPTESRNLFDSDPQRVAPAVAAMRAFFDKYQLRRPGYSPPYKP
ncbi:MAG: hypothetical protein DRI90_06955 [Deltaproteobacteria bacterium]|nr:MAG: hypothetical protein DRI90_06955 [Deltaproteobacteria bacterium]